MDVNFIKRHFIKRQYEKDENFRMKSFKGSKLTGYLKFQIALEIVDKKLDLDTAAKITQLSKRSLARWTWKVRKVERFADKGGRPQITTEDFRAEMLELVTTCDDKGAAMRMWQLREHVHERLWERGEMDYGTYMHSSTFKNFLESAGISETPVFQDKDASRRKAEKKLEWAQHSERPASEDGDTAGGRSKRRRTKTT
jgi:hypothetical protein